MEPRRLFYELEIESDASEPNLRHAIAATFANHLRGVKIIQISRGNVVKPSAPKKGKPRR